MIKIKQTPTKTKKSFKFIHAPWIIFLLFYFRFYNGIVFWRDTYTFDRTSNAPRKSLNNNKPRLALMKKKHAACCASASARLIGSAVNLQMLTADDEKKLPKTNTCWTCVHCGLCLCCWAQTRSKSHTGRRHNNATNQHPKQNKTSPNRNRQNSNKSHSMLSLDKLGWAVWERFRPLRFRPTKTALECQHCWLLRSFLFLISHLRALHHSLTS